MLFSVFCQIKRLHNLLDDEQTKSKKTEDSAKIPQINGPEMQLYEIQRKFSPVFCNLFFVGFIFRRGVVVTKLVYTSHVFVH